MKIHEFAVWGCLLLAGDVGAQVITGSVPVGYTLTSYGVLIEAAVDFSEDSTSIDVDCDGSDDFRFIVKRRSPEMDMPNRFTVGILSDSTEVCAADTASLCSFNHACLFGPNQALLCSPPFGLLVDNAIVIGDYVTFLCAGAAPAQGDSIYIHYRKWVDGVDVNGWILMSFDVESSNQLGWNAWAIVHSAIGVCGANGIHEMGMVRPHLVVMQDQANPRWLRWAISEPIDRIVITDLFGRTLRSMSVSGSSGEVEISKGRGVLCFSVALNNGTVASQPILVQ